MRGVFRNTCMLNKLRFQHKQHLVIKDCLAKKCFLKQSKDVEESTKVCNSFKHQFVILFCFFLDMNNWFECYKHILHIIES
jgi:hypothetical protein